MARSRRGRGEGGIYQRADGLWCGAYSAGYDGQGKRKRRVVYGKTKKEVQEKLRQCERNGRYIIGDVTNITLTKYLGQWLELVRPKVEPGTYRPYERH